jgi:4-methyl-5(b-hydroxyethyl)-thiazole monophosphate biosynthesis
MTVAAHMTRTALVPVAQGTEELEAVAIIDVLRRAGVAVTVATADNLHVTCSRGVRLVPDCHLADCTGNTYDLIALPGGIPGAENLRDSPELRSLLAEQNRKGGLVAAICAAPVVALAPLGLLESRRFTCHPAFAHLAQGLERLPEATVVDGNLVTSQGAGTAVAFALTLVELLFDHAARVEVARGMALTDGN